MRRKDGGIMIVTVFAFWAIALQCCAQSTNLVNQSPVRIGQLVVSVTDHRVVSVPGAHLDPRWHFEMVTLQVRNASSHPNCTRFRVALSYGPTRGDSILWMPPNRIQLGPRMRGLGPAEESKGSYIFEVEDDWKPSAVFLERDPFGERDCANTLDQPVDLSGGKRMELSLEPLKKGREGRERIRGGESVTGLPPTQTSNMDVAPAQLGQLRITLLEVRHALALTAQEVTMTPRKGYHFEAVVLAAQNTSAYENCTKLDASLGMPEEGAELDMHPDAGSLNVIPGSRAKICYIFLVHHSVHPRIFTLRLKPKGSDSDVLPWMTLDNPEESGCPPTLAVQPGSDTALFHLENYERGIEDTLDANSLSGQLLPQ